MNINKEQRLDILKMEMGLIQSTLDKYDDLIFRNRNWFITLWMGSIGLGFTIKSEVFLLLSVVLSIMYWLIEGMMRHQYWYKYVLRYRTLRESFNDDKINIEEISIYDLTNHYMNKHKTTSDRFKKSFFKFEPSVVYGLMSIGAGSIWCLVKIGIISLK